ncbi:MAG TPA: fibronectin type III domain-containing protein, partial [Gelria sp.]|nr:fibronectin type III domain-containing protein [Gelria sp.]
MKSKIALLTVLVFMLSMVCYLPLAQATNEGLTPEILEQASEITNQGDKTVLDTVYEANTGETPPPDNFEETILERTFNLNNFQPMEAPGPAELGFDDITNSSFKVSWPAAAGANGYKVTVNNKTGGVPTTIVNGETTQALEYDVTGLQSSYRYDVVVEAINGSWEGNVSSLQGLAVTKTTKTIILECVPGFGTGEKYYVFKDVAPSESTVFEKYFTYNNEIYPGKDRFLWYYQGGFNKTDARVHVDSFRLFNLSDNVEIPLDYGTTNFGSEGPNGWPTCDITEEDTGNILKRLETSGDFKVASYFESSIYVRFELDIADKLEPGRQYEITIDPQFHSGGRNNKYPLNKVYHFKF